MTKCGICGMDHAAERASGAERQRLYRVEQYGEPFRTITREEGSLGDMTELRATQTDDGAWLATVYRASYEEIPGVETGSYEFSGLAATEPRARALANAAAETLLRTWIEWQTEWDRERAERAAARETQ